jgi:integrase
MTLKVRVSDAIDSYQKRRKLQGITDGVLRNEKSTLTRLLNMTGNIYLENVRDTHVDDAQAEMAQTCSPRSMANKYHELNGFFRWCVESGRLKRSPMAGMRPPTFTVVERNRLEAAKFPLLLDAARSPRDRILMATALYTLGRSSECVTPKVGDVKREINRIRMPLAKKRGRDEIATDLKPITIEYWEELDRWFSAYSRECGKLQDDWYLIPTLTAGNPVRIKRVNPGDPGARMVGQHWVPTRPVSQNVPKQIVQEALEAVGYPTRADDGTSLGEGMHTLRRSGARARYDAKRWMGHDNAIRHVQALLNHKHAFMTEHYIGINLDKIQRDEELIGDYMYPQLRTDGTVVDFATQKALRHLATELQTAGGDDAVRSMLKGLLESTNLELAV